MFCLFYLLSLSFFNHIKKLTKCIEYARNNNLNFKFFFTQFKYFFYIKINPQHNTKTGPSNMYDHASVDGQSKKTEKKKKYMKCSRKSPRIHSSLLLVQREKGVAMRNGDREVAEKRPFHTHSPLGNP